MRINVRVERVGKKDFTFVFRGEGDTGITYRTNMRVDAVMQTTIEFPGQAWTLETFSVTMGKVTVLERIWAWLRRRTLRQFVVLHRPMRLQRNTVDGTDAIPGPFPRVVYDPGSVLGGGKK